MQIFTFEGLLLRIFRKNSNVKVPFHFPFRFWAKVDRRLGSLGWPKKRCNGNKAYEFLPIHRTVLVKKLLVVPRQS